MGVYNSSSSDKKIREELQRLTEVAMNLLGAVNSIQFNQPPMRATEPPKQIFLSPGEKKEIIPGSLIPRRIVISSISGETKLLLGSDSLIESSAISINENQRIIDERWQGKVFAYSLGGSQLLINIETETLANTDTEGEEIMNIPLNMGLWMHTDLEYYMGTEIDEAVSLKSGVAGYKMWKAFSFNPGQEYTFTLNVPPSIMNNITPGYISVSNTESFNNIQFAIYNIPYESLALACYSRIIGQLDGSSSGMRMRNFYKILEREAQLITLSSPGTFNLSFFDSRRIGFISCRTINYGWEVATLDYSATTQTFTVLGW